MFHLEFEYHDGLVEDSMLEYPNVQDARELAQKLFQLKRPMIHRLSVKNREGESVYDLWHFREEG